MNSRRSDGRGLEHAWKCTQNFNRNKRKEETTAHVGRIVDHRKIDGDNMECIYLCFRVEPNVKAPMKAV
jgi:hypothetical protein